MPQRNIIFEIIKKAESLTDDELTKLLVKDGIEIPQVKVNKILLDLEILGLIKVAWLSKDVKRIEIVIVKQQQDDIDKSNETMMERDYESSFPINDKN